jgi:hypothetical protein
MNITWRMKTRDGTGWRLMRLAEIQGRTIREILTTAAGTETVAEFILPTIGRCFFCGTDTLKQRMVLKGKAVTCDAGIRLIDSVYPDFLDKVVGDYLGAAEVFPDAEVEQLDLIP